MQILIIDDHTIIRRGVRNLLMERYPNAMIDDRCTLAQAEAAMAGNRSCLAILDLILGDGHAFDRLAEWRSKYPNTRILVYSMVPEHLYAERVVALGCSGFLSKQVPESELLAAVEHIHNGGTYLSANVLQQRGTRNSDGLAHPVDGLSEREIAVMHLLLGGQGIKEIAQHMNISPSTVATYKSRLLDKLGVSTVTELHRWAEVHGISS